MLRGCALPNTRWSAHYPIEAPAIRDAFELMLASIFKDQARTDDEVLHGARDEDLPWPG